MLFVIYLRSKKVFLFPKIGRVKIFYHSPARTVKCVLEYIFLISKNKETSKKQRKRKKEKETKKEKNIYPENQLKKEICGRLGEDFPCHPHFRKQEMIEKRRQFFTSLTNRRTKDCSNTFYNHFCFKLKGYQPLLEEIYLKMRHILMI